tara:strand:+ start:243 stop:1991 length:1749 start_codon:yes stop_codon:yes gene_type:complete
MTDASIERKIAVIFVTDAVGFSKLMAQNENATMQSLNACKDILARLFDEYGGRIFNTAGDSVLAEFQSAVSALICSTEFQKLIKQRNNTVTEEYQMMFRIGLNMGEVIVEGTNLYGDGVNVAARLESFCQPGGVSLSKSVHEFVSQKVDFNFADLGNQKVKNTLVHAFDVNIDGIQRRELNLEKNDELQDTGKPPTIAVIPFKNMSNDEEQEYFADGVSEDIISNLSSWKSFPVVSRNSSFSFKGRDAKTSEIAKELNANYIVEGSIRKSGNKVRITASLVDGKDEQQVWSKRWDRSLDDIFEVQDEVSQEVAALILPALKGREHERVKSKPPSSFSAWDNYLKGLALFNEHNRDIHIDEIMELCEKAISIDGQFCDAFVLKSRCLYDRMFTNEYSDQRESNEQKFHEVAFAAFNIDPNNPEAVSAYSRSFNLKKDYQQRLKYAEKALDLNPSHAGSNFDFGLALCNEKRFSEAESYIEKAIELDPIRSRVYEAFFPLLYMAMGNSKQAMFWSNIVYERNSHSRHDGFRAAISVHLGDLDGAKRFLDIYKKARPEIQNLDDYQKVTPAICEDYLLQGLEKIW